MDIGGSLFLIRNPCDCKTSCSFTMISGNIFETHKRAGSLEDLGLLTPFWIFLKGNPSKAKQFGDPSQRNPDRDTAACGCSVFEATRTFDLSGPPYGFSNTGKMSFIMVFCFGLLAIFGPCCSHP